METVKVKYVGFVFLHDGVLLLFEDLPDDIPLTPVLYESYFGDLRGLKIGALHATVPSQVFKFLLEKPKIYLGTLKREENFLVGGVMFVVENLDTDLLFEML